MRVEWKMGWKQDVPRNKKQIMQACYILMTGSAHYLLYWSDRQNMKLKPT